jgi:glycosyltransferase involved in cell wall biosynthesis
MTIPPDMILFATSAVLSLLFAAYTVVVAYKGHGVLGRISELVAEPVAQQVAPAVRARGPWRVGIDARAMIGEPGKEGLFRTYGVGQYLKNLLTALLEVDHTTEYVLWSSSLKYGVSAEYREFARRYKNVRAVHVRCPNLLVDATALVSRLSAVEEFIGRVDVSYDPNFFQVRPSRAFSICTVHDLSFRDPRFKSFMALQERAAWHANRADIITTVSETSKRIILENLGLLDEHRVRVIYGAAGEEFGPAIAARGFPSVREKYGIDGAYFVHVGELSARKNIRTLLSGFQKLRERVPGVSIFFVGCDMSDLAQMASTWGDSLRNVRCLGYVPQGDLASLYYGATAMVCASYEEGFGLPTVEALRTGQVVVLSDIAASNEVAGEAALYFDPTREDEIAGVLGRVLEMSAGERQLRVHRGLQLCRRFSWEQSAQQMLRLFEEGFRKRDVSAEAVAAPDPDG